MNDPNDLEAGPLPGGSRDAYSLARMIASEAGAFAPKGA